jgi:fido (protein-threonine AMPylation protein)
MHVPPNSEALRDAMPVFFEVLAEEAEPSVRVVLGHFIFVYIHPYMDGNGRIGRILMNVMLAAGGYPWDGGTAGTARRVHGRSGRGKRTAEHRAIRRLPCAACR